MIIDAAGTAGSALASEVWGTSVDAVEHANTIFVEGVKGFNNLVKAGEVGVKTAIMLVDSALDTADTMYDTITTAAGAIDTVLDTMFLV